MRITEYMESHGHEQLSFWTDPSAGLRAFIAIHDTTLGPALGAFASGPTRRRRRPSWTCSDCPGP